MASILSQATTITIDDSIGTPVVLTGHISFSTGDGSATAIDVTTLLSTAKEFKPGLRDEGNITIELIRDPDDLGQIELLEMLSDSSTREMVITTNATTLNVQTFQCHATSLNLDGAVDGVLTGTFVGKITDVIAYS